MTEETKTFDEEYVKDLRNEAASYRVKLRETEEYLTKLKEEWEQEKAQATEKEILYAAKAAGVVDPQTVTKLMDKESIAEHGIDAALNQLLQDKPFLKGGSVGKASNPADGNGQPRIFSRDEVDSMSQEDIKQNWDAIQEQMSKGLIK
jgi:hypothetical protein